MLKNRRKKNIIKFEGREKTYTNFQSPPQGLEGNDKLILVG